MGQERGDDGVPFDGKAYAAQQLARACVQPEDLRVSTADNEARRTRKAEAWEATLVAMAAGTACVAAHSVVRALYQNYSGPLYRLVRESDKAGLDVGVHHSGFAAVEAHDAFCKGTECWILRLYDQSPQARRSPLTCRPPPGLLRHHPPRPRPHSLLLVLASDRPSRRSATTSTPRRRAARATTRCCP